MSLHDDMKWGVLTLAVLVVMCVMGNSSLYYKRIKPLSPGVLRYNASIESILQPTVKRSTHWRYHQNKTLACESANVANSNVSDTPYTKIPRQLGFSPGQHEVLYTRQELAAVQACVYASLQRWWKLSEELSISHWSVAAGSLVGLLCYRALVPWDDDIDIFVFHEQCDRLITKFNALNRSEHQLDARFDTRGLDASFEILRMHGWLVAGVNLLGLIGYTVDVHHTSIFKLRHRKQLYISDVLGMDIFCIDQPAGLDPQRFYTVEFGPLSVKVYDDPIVMRSSNTREISCV